MFLGLGWPEWVTIIAVAGGLWLTFKVMARASVAYEKARKARQVEQDQSRESKQGEEES